MKQKHFLAAITALTMLTCVTAVPVSADAEILTETESNNTVSTATALPANTPIQGNTETSSDKDYYQLTLEENNALSLTFAIEEAVTTSTTHTYWYVSICDAEGTAIRKYAISGYQLTYNLSTLGLEAGTYYICVEAYGTYYYSTQTYTLTAKAENETNWESEDNDTMKNADALPVNTDFYGCTHDAADVDWYQITLEEDSALDVRFAIEEALTTSTSYTYWKIFLCNDEGNALTSYTISGSKLVYNLSTMGLDAGKYYLRVEANNSYYYSTQPYTLTANASSAGADWESESNNTLSGADAMTANTPINGRLHDNSDKDYYRLELEKNGTLDLKFTIEPDSSNTSNYWKLSLLDADGNTLQTTQVKGSNATTRLGEYAAAAGTYYICVESTYSYWTTQYTLTAEYGAASYLLGDVNEDSAVDAVDASLILIAAAKIGAGTDSGLSETQALAADVNGVDGIDATDASIVLRYAAAVGAGGQDVKLEDFI